MCVLWSETPGKKERSSVRILFEVVTGILWYRMFLRKTLPPTHHVTRFHLPPSIFLVAPFPFFLWLVHCINFSFLSYLAHFLSVLMCIRTTGQMCQRSKPDNWARISVYPVRDWEKECRASWLTSGRQCFGNHVVGRTQEISVNQISCAKHGEHAFSIPVCLPHTWCEEF